MNTQDSFRTVAQGASKIVGSPPAFALAVVLIIVWAVVGPLFNFSDTWQLVVNTGTTIVTFIIVFLVQNTQNRDALAIQLKLDELLRVQKTRKGFLELEELSEDELERLQREFARLGKKTSLPGSKRSPTTGGKGSARERG